MATGDALCDWGPFPSGVPTSNYATVDSRNTIACLDFDPTTEESAYFVGRLPANYGGGGLTLTVHWTATSATTGAVVWGGSIERQGTDIDADSFATEQLSSAATTNGTSGIETTTTIAFSSGANMDSLAAGERFRLKLARKVNDGGDNMSGDAEVLWLALTEQ